MPSMRDEIAWLRRVGDESRIPPAVNFTRRTLTTQPDELTLPRLLVQPFKSNNFSLPIKIKIPAKKD